MHLFSVFPHTRKSHIRFCIAAIAIFLTAASQAEPLSDSEKVKVYDEAVHILGGNANVISRWQGDINYLVVGSTSFHKQAVETILDVAKMTDLKANEMSSTPTRIQTLILENDEITCRNNTGAKRNSQCANFIVVQSSQQDMLKLAAAIPLRSVYQKSLDSQDPVLCFFAPFVSSRQIIEQAYVFVNQEIDSALIQTCLNEEIYQSFGLFNDFSGARYFSFNNSVKPKRITEYDRSLLKTLYDPKFSPGTPVFRVMKRYMNVLKYSQK